MTLWLGVGTAAAQMAGEGADPSDGAPGRFQVAAFVGWVLPLSNLTENEDTFSTVVNPYVAFGVDATYWVSETFGNDRSGTSGMTVGRDFKDGWTDPRGMTLAGIWC